MAAVRRTVQKQRIRIFSYLDNGDGNTVTIMVINLPQKRTDTVRVNVTLISKGENFFVNRIDGSKNIEAFTTRRGGDEVACETPEDTQKDRPDTVRSIHKKDNAFAGFGFF